MNIVHKTLTIWSAAYMIASSIFDPHNVVPMLGAVVLALLAIAVKP